MKTENKIILALAVVFSAWVAMNVEPDAAKRIRDWERVTGRDKSPPAVITQEDVNRALWRKLTEPLQ